MPVYMGIATLEAQDDFEVDDIDVTRSYAYVDYHVCACCLVDGQVR
jgi:hypothetical protein